MVRFLIERPVAVVMTFLALTILGIIAWFQLPVSLLPDIPIPEITVRAVHAGASARSMEKLIAAPIRAQLMQVAGLADLDCESREGVTVVYLHFKYGVSTDYAFIEVNEKIDALMAALPQEIGRPQVVKASATDIPVFNLNIRLKEGSSADQFLDLGRFARNVLQRRIEQLPEVALVDVTGTPEPRLTIEPDFDALHRLGLTTDDIEQVLAANNISPGALSIRDGHYTYSLHFLSQVQQASDVENLSINAKGQLIRLGQVAKVSLGSTGAKGFFYSAGRPAICMSVIKQHDTQISDLKARLDEFMGQIKADYPAIEFEISQDQTRLLNYTVNNLRQNLLQGMVLVALVVFVFMKDIKAPFLIGSTMVISLIISLLLFYLLGLSVNIISLSGLILAMGNMIDNSIVVTDNITQHRERGSTLDQACVKGVNEIIAPMLSSMLTNISIFLPLVFISGIAGALFSDEALSVAIGLGVSYLTGITLMPVIYYIAYRSAGNQKSEKQQRTKDFLAKWSARTEKFRPEVFYEKGFNWVFRYKRLTLFLTILSLPLMIGVFYFIPKEKMPLMPETESLLTIDWNENIEVTENLARTSAIMQRALDKKIYTDTYIGTQQFVLQPDKNLFQREAILVMQAPDESTLVRIKTELDSYLRSRYPLARFAFEPVKTIFEKTFNNGEDPLVVIVPFNGADSKSLIPALISLSDSLKALPGAKANAVLPFEQGIEILADQEALLRYQVSVMDVLKALQIRTIGKSVGKLASASEYIPIIIADSPVTLNDLISTTNIQGPKGELIPLRALVKIRFGMDFHTIYAGKEGESARFGLLADSKSLAKSTHKIREMCSKAGFSNIRFGGSLISGNAIFRELAFVLIISLLLLYFILAAQFGSLSQPLLVLLELPVDIAGALLVLWITGHSLNLMSAIGIVVMCGVIINDSILKIDIINQLRHEGYSLMDAIVEGGHRRLRAILMTGLTSILAMVPLFFTDDLGSELQKPFALALIAGMVVGTLVSLYVVPLVYWYINRKRL